MTPSLLWFAAIVVAAYFAFEALFASWVHLTERYTIGDGYVRIRRGWASKTSGVIPTRNIAEARAVMPLLLRMLGVGLVVIETNDGSRHVMHNIKYPERIAYGIKPPFEPVVARPSVG